MKREKVRFDVVDAAEEALSARGYVTPIDVLIGARVLFSGHVESWRQGRIHPLQTFMQGGLDKIRFVLQVLDEFAAAKGLRPSETAYVRATREGPANLVFTAGADPEIEKALRTHYVSPALDERKQAAIKTKLETPDKPPVFIIVKESACSECGVEIERDDFLYMEGSKPLCLACAKMDDLEFLPAGDTALTRRTTKHSSRTAVVLRFSRSRGRYERQGILAEPAAVAKAEEECTADAADRAAARQRASVARERHDELFTAQMTVRILELFPRMPPKEALAIAAHTAQRGSGRVGRSAAGRKLDEEAMTLAVRAAVRHRHTDYDEMLARGADRENARARVRDRVDDIVESWR